MRVEGKRPPRPQEKPRPENRPVGGERTKTAAELGWDSRWEDPPSASDLEQARKNLECYLPLVSSGEMSSQDVGVSFRSVNLTRIAALFLLDRQFTARVLGNLPCYHSETAREIKYHGEEFFAVCLGLVLRFEFDDDNPKSAFLSTALSMLGSYSGKPPDQVAAFLDKHGLVDDLLALAGDEEAVGHIGSDKAEFLSKIQKALVRKAAASAPSDQAIQWRAAWGRSPTPAEMDHARQWLAKHEAKLWPDHSQPGFVAGMLLFNDDNLNLRAVYLLRPKLVVCAIGFGFGVHYEVLQRLFEGTTEAFKAEIMADLLKGRHLPDGISRQAAAAWFDHCIYDLWYRAEARVLAGILHDNGLAVDYFQAMAKNPVLGMKNVGFYLIEILIAAGEAATIWRGLAAAEQETLCADVAFAHEMRKLRESAEPVPAEPPATAAHPALKDWNPAWGEPPTKEAIELAEAASSELEHEEHSNHCLDRLLNQNIDLRALYLVDLRLLVKACGLNSFHHIDVAYKIFEHGDEVAAILLRALIEAYDFSDADQTRSAYAAMKYTFLRRDMLHGARTFFYKHDLCEIYLIQMCSPGHLEVFETDPELQGDWLRVNMDFIAYFVRGFTTVFRENGTNIWRRIGVATRQGIARVCSQDLTDCDLMSVQYLDHMRPIVEKALAGFNPSLGGRPSEEQVREAADFVFRNNGSIGSQTSVDIVSEGINLLALWLVDRKFTLSALALCKGQHERIDTQIKADGSEAFFAELMGPLLRGELADGSL